MCTVFTQHNQSQFTVHCLHTTQPTNHSSLCTVFTQHNQAITVHCALSSHNTTKQSQFTVHCLHTTQPNNRSSLCTVFTQHSLVNATSGSTYSTVTKVLSKINEPTDTASLEHIIRDYVELMTSPIISFFCKSHCFPH